MTRIIFGDYLPDQPAHLNPGVIVADGVIPIAGGYAPFSGFAPARNGALPARCIGAAGYRHLGTTWLFAATNTNIYIYSAAGYASVASGLSGSRDIGMHFCPFGPYMLATNGSDPIKQFDPAAPTAMPNLAGSPPTARYLATVRGFAVAGFAGGNPLRIAWSDSGNPSNWTAGGASEAGLYDMAGGGDITGLAGGDYGLVFQENRIVRMTYTADDTIWQFDEIVSDAGCAAPKSLATWGKQSFFWSERGFMACDGTSVQPIGEEKVDRTFRSLVDRAYYGAMSAVIDPLRALYIVAVPSADPTTSVFVYNYAQGRWSTAPLPAEILFSAMSLATGLEEIDALYGSIDSGALTLDSPALRGGAPAVMLFDTSHCLGTLSGTPVAATITDAIREPSPGARSRLRAVRPLTDATQATIVASSANGSGDAWRETVYSVRTPNGSYRCRENAGRFRLTLSIPGGANWSYAQGHDLETTQGGRA